MSRLLPSLQPAGAASAAVVLQPLTPLAPSRMEQCLLLAVLLHILLVLVLGNTPGGTARRGEGVWGALNITLRSDALNAPRPGPGAGLPAPPEQHSGPTGEARQRRYGGAVRAAPAPADAEPGAARLGQWRPHTAEPSAAPAALQPLESPPLATPEPAPAVPAVPLALPEPTPLARHTPSAALGQAPALQAETEALPSLPAIPALGARPRAAVRPPSVSGAAVAAPEALPALPAFEAPPLPPAALPALPEPSPATPVQALPQLSPSTRLEAPDLPAAPSAPTVPQPERPPAPAAQPVTVAPSTPDPGSRTSPAPSATAAVPPAGSPDAGARQGHDVATPASTPPNAPRLNLNLPLTRGGEVSSRGSRGVLPLVPHPPELKSKLSESIEKAAKSDCRQAYQEMGLLAALPLAADAARNKGCRW
ncbi:hypothetical protein PEC18_10980 [Paucibacter sp. O1-1]|nr:hypothetical protein [Paucibacter sp. O1-1]MDA3826351.1 hypothetical protein [Paucibacter sp. O1-1]